VDTPHSAAATGGDGPAGQPADVVRDILGQASETHARMRALDPAPIVRAVALCLEAIDAGGKILIFGNGGSAAESQHFATELTIRFARNRRALPAIALTTDTSALTAAGNDLGFERIFARQVEALGREGDVAIGISTSGSSPNVLMGLLVARERGLRTIAMTGQNTGLMQEADAVIAVPDPVTARVQEVQLTVLHILCELIERASV
jgi:D-sedoheptulose 7-phosphate isomerase